MSIVKHSELKAYSLEFRGLGLSDLFEFRTDRTEAFHQHIFVGWFYQSSHIRLLGTLKTKTDPQSLPVCFYRVGHHFFLQPQAAWKTATKPSGISEIRTSVS